MSWPESLSQDVPISFVPMAAVDDVTGAIVAAESRPIDDVWRGYKRFAEGDVIFARITPCMENGKAAIATGLLNGIGTGSTEFHVLRPTEAISAEWVYHFVRQQSFRNEAAREMTGTAGQLRVPKSFVEDAAIPLPPLPEQRRIVAKIQALFVQSRRAREALDAVPDLLAQFRQAVLAAAFRGKLTERDPGDEPAAALLERIRAERRRRWEADLHAQGVDPSRRKYKDPEPPNTSKLPELPEGWVWATLDTLAEVRNGVTKGRDLSRFETIEVPYLRVANVQSGYLDLDVVKIIEIKASELSKYKLVPNDILFTEGGDRDKLGRGTVWRGEIETCIHQNHIFAARLFFDEVDPQWVSLASQVPYARDYFWAVARQTVNLASINATKLRAFPIPLPPAKEQRRIVARIEALFAQAETLEAAAQVARRRLEQAGQAILARAFRGELVPQDPADEPAYKLLDRIRAGQKSGGEEG